MVTIYNITTMSGKQQPLCRTLDLVLQHTSILLSLSITRAMHTRTVLTRPTASHYTSLKICSLRMLSLPVALATDEFRAMGLREVCLGVS